MESQQTIKLSLQSIEIPAINIYVHIISLLLIALLVKLIFGKKISDLLGQAAEKVKDRLSRESLKDWVAKCRVRKDWPQKQDALSLDLKGRYLKSLTFSVILTGNPKHWRAGFIIGNEKLRANEIIDVKNGITIHTGSEYQKKDKLLPVWKYYEAFGNGNPDFSSVKSDDAGNRTFQIDITKNNFMQVKVQNDVIFAQKINPSFRRRAYLKAWADDQPDVAIKFKNISYSLWS